MFDGFEKRTIELDEVSIHFAMAGNGPPVLLLHGYPQSLALWARVAPLLAEDYTVVCSDLRGYGDSSKPHDASDHSTYSFRNMAEDNLRLMRALGHETFHLVGHDRGARTGHRLALDHPKVLQSLALLDIVPTHTLFTETNRQVAGSYWHWYFLSQPEPFPEHMIGLDPDFFYETCLVGWGATKLEDFDAAQLGEYRRCWRNEDMIHGSCSDYRAAATVDLAHDEASLDQTIKCPVLIAYGHKGVMAKHYDIPSTWQTRCEEMTVKTIDGGHFFIDTHPDETAAILSDFLRQHTS